MKRLVSKSEITIRSMADIKGVKIRSPEGLASEVFKRVGAAPVSLPFSEVYTALEKGLIDAADASAHSSTTKLPACTRSRSSRSIRVSTRWPCCSSSLNKHVWGKPQARTTRRRWRYGTTAAYDAMRREADIQDR